MTRRMKTKLKERLSRLRAPKKMRSGRMPRVTRRTMSRYRCDRKFIVLD